MEMGGDGLPPCIVYNVVYIYMVVTQIKFNSDHDRDYLHPETIAA